MAAASYDLGQPDAANEQARAAFTYGQVIDHDTLQAWARATLSMIALRSGRPHDGATHARSGLEFVTTGDTAVRLHALAGRCWALAGATTEATEAMQQADEAREHDGGVDEFADDIGGEFVFSPARQALCGGATHLALGNPTEAAEQARTGDLPDGRDFVRGSESNQKLRNWSLVTQVAGALRTGQPAMLATDDSARELAAAWLDRKGPLSHTAVNELIEFGRITHAEMATICTAARNGIALGGSTLFCTTYPCHMCMRLVIDVGIDRLVYIHPYPKSRVEEMYDSEASHGHLRADSDLR